MGFHPMYVSMLKILCFFRRTQRWMKTNLDQISIPLLCTGMSEMAHTLLGKALPPQMQGHGSQWVPMGAICRTLGRVRDKMENFLCFFVFFLCFDVVPFVGDPPECRGYVAFPPTCGPPRRYG